MSIDPVTNQLAAQGVAYAPQIAGAARRHGVDAELLAAVAAQETGGPGSNAGHNIVGDGGHGRGVFQIDDRWHAFAQTPAAMDPAKNADYAAGMISGLLQRYDGNVHRALSAYNAGDPDATGTRTQWPDGRRLGYADSVMQHYSQLTGEAPPTQAAPAAVAAAAASSTGACTSEHSSDNVEALLEALGALAMQAQSLPLAPAPQSAQQSYQPQVIDYGGLIGGDVDG